MGLDMYAHYLHAAPEKPVDFEVESKRPLVTTAVSAC